MTSSLFVQTRARLNGSPYRPAGVIIAGDGTAYTGFPAPPQPELDNGTGYWSGFSSGLVGGCANVVDGLWDSYCVGYSAPTVPMWPGVQEGREKMVSFLLTYALAYHSKWGDFPPIIGSGYSQFTMAWDQVWVLDILPDNGRLNFLKNYVYRIYQFGHIFRSPGIAHANALAGLPESIKQDGVETGGIGLSLDLTPEQTNYQAPDGRPVVYSAANKGDLYTCCSTGLDPWKHPAPESKVGNIFEKIIMQPTFTDVVEVAAVLMEPLSAIMELFHTMAFFGGGQTPHTSYFPQMVACITDVVALGNSLPHQLGV